MDSPLRTAVLSGLRSLAIVATALALTACGGGSNSDNSNPPPTPSYTLGGTVSGLTVDGLVLASNGQTVTVNANATTFALPTSLTTGTAYAVTVQTTPAGLTCSVANGTGTMATANINNVVVTCADQSYTVGGTISGLTTSGLVLANGTDRLSVPSGDTSFTMPTAVAYTSSYAVTVATQPQGLSCSVQNGSSTMGAGNVTNISITCSNQSYALGGTVSGLIVPGLVLANGADTVSVPANATSFTFPTSVAFGSSYAVTVATQPAGLTCSVTSATGNMPAANVSSVAVMCSDLSYTLGGQVTGLTSTGLVLANGTDTVSLPANATTFTFQTAVAFMSQYAVTVATQPTGLTCTVASGSGAMPAANVTSVKVTCSIGTYTLGGTISGLTASGLVLTDGTDNLSVAANATVFSMPTGVAYNSPYAVTVAKQPAGLTCSVTNGSGTMPSGNVSSVQVACSPRQWTWQGGPNIAARSGVYGTPGTPAAGNWPGARDGHMTWTDSSGRFWLFGGYAVDSTGNSGDINDLWVYDQVSARWTWVSGSNTAQSAGVYGTPGVAAPGNTPGARHSGVTWVDRNGRVWLFGGFGVDAAGTQGYLNDLWSYDPTSGSWTWVSGSQTANATGVYGPPGVPAASNVPGARSDAASWIDSAGRLWLFGGQVLDATSSLYVSFNDLWSFDPSTGEWAWMAGSSTATDVSGVYGTLGVPAASNAPGSRYGAATWVDRAGNFWLFGGVIYSSGSPLQLNDLWSYNLSTGQWTWVAGANTNRAIGSYGTLGIAATTNIPGARGAPLAWTDNTGRFWLFGGYGFGGTTPLPPGFLNDLWMFDPTTQQWTWVSGQNVPSTSAGVYTFPPGTPGAMPGSRIQSSGWADSSGNLWFFGGNGYDSNGLQGSLSDLWMF